MRVSMGGAEVDLVHRDELTKRVQDQLNGAAERPLHLLSANLDHIFHFGVDSGFQGVFSRERTGADWLVMLDGMPLVWLARRRTGDDWEQLAGSEFLPALLDLAMRSDARVGFLGGTQEQHVSLQQALAASHPKLPVAAMWAPARSVIDDPRASDALASTIRDAGVDVLVVALGKPRQELWLLQHGSATGARVTAAFGAAPDFLAGTSKRAPRWMSRLGLEWLHRLARDPRRLWRRYLLEGPVSLWRLLRHTTMALT